MGQLALAWDGASIFIIKMLYLKPTFRNVRAGLGMQLKQQSTCLDCMNPWVQSPGTAQVGHGGDMAFIPAQSCRGTRRAMALLSVNFIT